MSRHRRLILLGALVCTLLLAQPFAQISGAASRPASGSNSKAGAQAQGGGTQDLHAAARRLRDDARGVVSISTRKSTGFAGFVRVSRTGDLFPASQAQTAEGKAAGFVDHYGEVLGIDANDAAQLRETTKTTDRYGFTHVTYQQRYQGVPVFGATLQVHVDGRGRLTAVNGAFVPDISLPTTPNLSAQEAAGLAVAEVAADPPRDSTGARVRVSESDLRAASTKLYVYRTGLIRDVPGTNQLVYRVEVTDGRAVRDFVFVSAHVGKVVNRYSAVNDALHRVLYEASAATPPIWEEGDPFPGLLNEDQQNIVEFSGHAYYHFFNAFGRDSYDGAGAFMRSVNNDPTIACPNANWNGSTTNYCNGVTADDVVAHEWGHAYTEHTHNLIYQWQPGALNESYSDIWGELVDQINGAGTDSPQGARSDGACSTHTNPLPRVIINSPPSIAGECAAAPAQFGPPLTETGITDDVVLADDGVSPGSDACTPLVNGTDVSGNIALVDRGGCTFAAKVKTAQDAGAVGVVVANNAAGPPAAMGGSDPTITIPSVMISLDNGNLIKSELPNGVNVTMKLGGSTAREDSYRWLMGEDATAFGTAIRDMWSPTCLGDPGKVTDAEYHCDVSDGGGVHTNSGIPNHGFALLVDGGTYNGHTVDAIGPVKAAHMYWRAQSVYQTPTTDFSDHADSLQAACNDLVASGEDLEGLSTTPAPAGSSGEAMTAGDCTAVDEMIAAVELRTDPTDQCNFTPLLDPDAPPLCAAPDEPGTLFHEDFEDGLDGWTATNTVVFPEGSGFEWAQSTELPGERAGAAAFATDPNTGNCSGGAGDNSSAMFLESPDITIPTGEFTPRLAFEHYVATEALWDGGNVNLSVDGGPYTLVPEDAYTFNPYNATLNPAPNNTNPLQGEPAFTGTDGGEVTGSWGQSQVDLSAAGVAPGDTIRLRFDFGMDGCAGVDGWYVDDVHVFVCQAAPSAVDDSYTTDEDTELVVAAPGVLGNDTDPEGDDLTAELDTGPSHGVATINEDGSFSYTPEADFAGTDSFTYTARDSMGTESQPATVTITVEPVNDAPIVTVARGGECDRSGGTMLLHLADPDGELETLTLTATSSDEGVVRNSDIEFGGSGADRTITIDPRRGRGGSATVTIEVSDGELASTTTITFIGSDRRSRTITGTSGADMIVIGGRSITVNAGDGNDLVCGGNGNDSLTGGPGDDTLVGGNGNDSLTGGPGADVFVGGRGFDTVTDFNAGEGDTRDGSIP